MFSKRVKLVRDLFQESIYLQKKIEREIAKFDDALDREVRKKFKRIAPGVQIKICAVSVSDFVKSKNRKEPLIVWIDSFNHRKIHRDGVWLLEGGEGEEYEAENVLSLDTFFDIIDQLSEELGVKFDVLYSDGSYLKE